MNLLTVLPYEQRDRILQLLTWLAQQPGWHASNRILVYLLSYCEYVGRRAMADPILDFYLKSLDKDSGVRDVADRGAHDGGVTGVRSNGARDVRSSNDVGSVVDDNVEMVNRRLLKRLRQVGAFEGAPLLQSFVGEALPRLPFIPNGIVIVRLLKLIVCSDSTSKSDSKSDSKSGDSNDSSAHQFRARPSVQDKLRQARALLCASRDAGIVLTRKDWWVIGNFAGRLPGLAGYVRRFADDCNGSDRSESGRSGSSGSSGSGKTDIKTAGGTYGERMAHNQMLSGITADIAGTAGYVPESTTPTLTNSSINSSIDAGAMEGLEDEGEAGTGGSAYPAIPISSTRPLLVQMGLLPA